MAVAFLLGGVVVEAQPVSPDRMPGAMMGCGMMMSGWLMAVCVAFGVLLFAALVLAIQSLIKYLRGDREETTVGRWVPRSLSIGGTDDS